MRDRARLARDRLPRLSVAISITRRTAASGWPLRAAGFKAKRFPASTRALGATPASPKEKKAHALALRR